MDAIHDYAARHGLQIPADAQSLFVPGRIELLGKHTDYAGGSSLTAALSRGLFFLTIPREDSTVVLHAVDFDDHISLDPDNETLMAPGHWSAYTRQVVKRIFNNFETVQQGATILVSSTLPVASGMSSSSAFVVGTFICLGRVNGVSNDPAFKDAIATALDLADYLSTVENGGDYKSLAGDTGVGTLGGSEDHTAILASRPGMMGLYSYRPTQLREYINWPADLSLVILSSGVEAQKSGAAKTSYNRASRLAASVIDAWNEKNGKSVPHLGDLIRSEDFKADDLRDFLQDRGAESLLKRFEHFHLEETELIPGAVDAFKRNDQADIAKFISHSASAADELLDNQVDETRYLVNSAVTAGALCASPFGAGFGGSVYAIVKRSRADTIAGRWLADYLKEFPGHEQKAEVFVDEPRAGADM